jgi:hypothetical protein
MSDTRQAIPAVSSIPYVGTGSSLHITYLQTECGEYIVNGWLHYDYHSVLIAGR